MTTSAQRPDQGRPRSPRPAAAGNDRRSRRAEQRLQEKERRRRQTARRAQRGPRCRAIGLFSAAVVVVVGLGLVLGLTLGGGGRASSSRIAVQPLLRVPAVSSVAEGLGSGWLTDDYSRVLRRFDPATGRLRGSPLALPGRPASLTIAFGRVWVASMLTDTVEEIAPSPPRVLRTIHVPAGPSGFAVAGGRLWVTSVIAGAVSAIDPVRGEVVGSATPSDGAVRATAGYGAVWVTGSTDTISAFSPRVSGNHLQWRTINVGQGPLGVAAGHGAIWVATALDGAVVEVDPVHLVVRARRHTGPDPVAVVVQGGRVWVADGRSAQIGTVGSEAGPSQPLPGVPRQLYAVGDGVWVAVGRPGAVALARVR